MLRSPVFSLAVAVTLTVGLVFHVGTAEAGFGLCKLCKTCPNCDYECHLDAEQVDVGKSCFEVETKVICVPRVVFPWQRKKSCGECDSCDGRGCNSCIHNGAKIRCIRRLKKKKYSCPECEYTWTATRNACGDCDSGCDSCETAGGTGVLANEMADEMAVPENWQASTTSPSPVQNRSPEWNSREEKSPRSWVPVALRNVWNPRF